MQTRRAGRLDADHRARSPPDIYGYTFVADGVALTDPSNPLTKPNLVWQSSAVHVPGRPRLPWEVADVPRGTLHRHFYRSAVVGDDRDYYVYTPPGLRRRRGHALSRSCTCCTASATTPSGWTAVGRAHVILDNLIAQGKAKPMLVVMPLGYGAPEIVRAGFGGFRDPAMRQRNFDRFRDALLDRGDPAGGEVVPGRRRPRRRGRSPGCRWAARSRSTPASTRSTASPGSAPSAPAGWRDDVRRRLSRASTRRPTTSSACSGSRAAPRTG